jgi:DNA-binding PadR family transcriptional regulator
MFRIMSANGNNSVLGYALLGLLHQRPLSGYDAKKIFTSSPMGGFSDSPGAIYPALSRLEKRGLVRGEIEDGTGLRRRRVYHITPSGVASLKAWQRKPIADEDVVRGIGELLLRFAFMDETLGAEGSQAFLKEFAGRLSSYVPGLREYLSVHGKSMSLSGRLALESGIQEYEARMSWAKSSIAHYQRRRKLL